MDIKSDLHAYSNHNLLATCSVYHTREVDVFKLAQVWLLTGCAYFSRAICVQRNCATWCQYRTQIDILISHDWPRGIYHFGNKAQLVRKKPFFLDEVPPCSVFDNLHICLENSNRYAALSSRGIVTSKHTLCTCLSDSNKHTGQPGGRVSLALATGWFEGVVEEHPTHVHSQPRHFYSVCD